MDTEGGHEVVRYVKRQLQCNYATLREQGATEEFIRTPTLIGKHFLAAVQWQDDVALLQQFENTVRSYACLNLRVNMKRYSKYYLLLQ